ncbi:PIN domain-containing protein [Bacteroidia bacterium]|nr:PIN domain-containing protein [Bacteroidia bacterium]
MKIVLDTNCLLPSIFSKSPYHWVWEAFCEARYTLCCSTDIIQEYEELLTHFYSVEISESVISTILNAANLEQVTPYYKWNLIADDADDNKFVDCALNAGVDYIVTNDKHFNILKFIDFPQVKVVDIETFRTIISLY